MQIGQAIRMLMDYRNVTQIEMSNKIGISQTSISLIITGKTQPKKKTLELIADYLKVKVSIILILSLDRDDIPKHRRRYYDELYPVIQNLLLKMI